MTQDQYALRCAECGALKSLPPADPVFVHVPGCTEVRMETVRLTPAWSAEHGVHDAGPERVIGCGVLVLIVLAVAALFLARVF